MLVGILLDSIFSSTMSLKLHFTQIEAIAQLVVDVLKPSDTNSVHDKSAC